MKHHETPSASAAASAANRNQLRSEATRLSLLRVARKLFIEHGYYQTTMEDILAAAAVSKGAFYHHFKTKSDAFLGVYVAMHEEIVVAALASGAEQTDPWTAMIATFERYFLEVSDPAVYRLLLLDAKTVLTHATQIEIDNRYGNAVVKQIVEDVIESGHLSRRLEPFTPLIVGGVADCLVDWCARQSDPTAFLPAVREKFMTFLDLLRSGEPLPSMSALAAAPVPGPIPIPGPKNKPRRRQQSSDF